MVDYLSGQLEKLGIRIELGKQVTIRVVEEQSPDVVIIAVGGTPRIPSIKGIEKIRVHSSEDVLSGKASLGSRVLVIGGGYVGREVALFLSEPKHMTTSSPSTKSFFPR